MFNSYVKFNNTMVYHTSIYTAVYNRIPTYRFRYKNKYIYFIPNITSNK